jgi:hypothetical protein
VRHSSRATIAAVCCAALVGLLYLSPVLKDVVRTGLDWPIWVDHPEGLMNTSYGKWLAHAPHRYLVDGNTGEFPTYYACLSDTLINVLAVALGCPAMTVQAVIFGPVLGAAFLLGNYLSIAGLVRDRRAAFAASLLISLGGNSTFFDRPETASGLSLNAVLHVPFHVISLATAQSLGWVLLLPCLSAMHFAYRDFTRRRAILAGVLLGTLFHAHTLTFVNVGAAQVAYFVLANALERPRNRHFRAWLATLGVLTAAFLVLVLTRPSLSFALLAALGSLVLLATFVLDPEKRFYLWSYGAAGLVALPYLVVLARHAHALGAVQEGWNQVQMMTVGLSGFLWFFAAYIAAAAFGWRALRDRSLRIFAAALLGSTALLAVNHLWHWGNHPYRFAIHLLFPLAILAALGLREAPRPVGRALGAWLGAVCLFDAGGFALGRQVSVRFRVAEPERAAFLKTVREVTARDAIDGLRLLGPVELTYPRGAVQAAMLMNYSRIPAFVPDYRHVLWRERHFNRMGLFCFLFPGYPNNDYPFGRRGCEEALDPDPELGLAIDPRLKPGILPVYRIGLAGGPAKPLSTYVKDASPRYGWPIVTQTDSAALVRTDVASLPGVARLGPGALAGPLLAIAVTPDAPGPHVIVLGGRRLRERAPEIQLDGRPLAGGRRTGNWAVFEAELAAGPHRLELPSHASGLDPQADYLYFAAAVQRSHARDYVGLALPPLTPSGARPELAAGSASRARGRQGVPSPPQRGDPGIPR